MKYQEALDVRRSSPNAYGFLIGRILEALCLESLGGDKTLYAYIEELKKKEIFSKTMASIAHSIRELRNDGTHPERGELTSDDIPLLDALIQKMFKHFFHKPTN